MGARTEATDPKLRKLAEACGYDPKRDRFMLRLMVEVVDRIGLAGGGLKPRDPTVAQRRKEVAVVLSALHSIEHAISEWHRGCRAGSPAITQQSPWIRLAGVAHESCQARLQPPPVCYDPRSETLEGVDSPLPGQRVHITRLDEERGEATVHHPDLPEKGLAVPVCADPRPGSDALERTIAGLAEMGLWTPTELVSTISVVADAVALLGVELDEAGRTKGTVETRDGLMQSLAVAFHGLHQRSGERGRKAARAQFVFHALAHLGEHVAPDRVAQRLRNPQFQVGRKQLEKLPDVPDPVDPPDAEAIIEALKKAPGVERAQALRAFQPFLDALGIAAGALHTTP